VGKSQAAEARARPRTDAELAALLETSRTPGKWYVSMRSATATMIGRGCADAEIRSACAPYCTGGFDESDIDDFLDRGRAKWNIPDGASVERLARLTRLKYDQQRKEAAAGSQKADLSALSTMLAQKWKSGVRGSPMGQRQQACTALTTAIEMYRVMEMTFWLPQAEAALAQVEVQ
jgi:hypothetical protein